MVFYHFNMFRHYSAIFREFYTRFYNQVKYERLHS